MRRQVLVTGVAGFIGSRVARRFLDEGYAVVGVDDLSSGRIENVPRGVEFIRGDLSKKSTFLGIPSGCTKILHLAGQSSGEVSFDDPVLDLEKNTIATLNLISYGIANKVERFIYASSMSVYGAVQDAAVSETKICTPLSCYGIGKYASESYLRVYEEKLPFVILRMFNVFGPGQDMSNLRQGMVSIFLAQALSNGRIEVRGSCDRFRDFIYIDDVVEIWFRATTRMQTHGQVLNVGTGVRTSVRGLLEKICSLIPNTSFFTAESTPGDQEGIFADVSKLVDTLGLISFTPLDTGLLEFVNWAKRQRR